MSAAESTPAQRSWQSFFRLTRKLEIPDDFLQNRNDAPPQKRVLF